MTTVDNQPVGGTRFPDAALPLGVLTPASVPPVTTRLITETCGNLGGFRPFTAAELPRRYVTADRYLAAYTVLLDRLIRRGLVLPADRAGILIFAATRYRGPLS
ncbi:alpha/beta hydrolase domain-containing protein [Pseudonocardia sp.]|uniref:alpha/beta hydrolase domain-containing protein n=1 Tax=Pseudonocardia sp. TaxID=60912 RepID=UPI0031FCAEDB